MENKKKLNIFQCIFFSLKTSFIASPPFFLLKVLFTLLQTCIPLINLWIWRQIINGTVSGKTFVAILLWLALYLMLKLISYGLTTVGGWVEWWYSQKIFFYFERILIDKVAHIDLSFFDSSTMNDEIGNLFQNVYNVTELIWVVFRMLASVVSVISSFVIVTSYKWWAGAVIVLLLIPYTVYQRWHKERMYRVNRSMMHDNREKGYIQDLFQHNSVQFEMKLYGFADHYINRFHKAYGNMYRINRKEEVRDNIVSGLLTFFNFLGDGLILVATVTDIIAGHMLIGDLQYHVGMVSQLRTQISTIIGYVNELHLKRIKIEDVLHFMSIEPVIEKSGDRTPSPCPRIEFCNVSFRYPACENYVLKDCSFVIEPHEKIGLIGLNGAGKSTIIKLMFRFYDPESGVIKLDGVDLKEYDVYKVRKIFGTLFQEYVTYHLPLREIIALSDFESRFDDEKLQKACDISGVSAIIKDWEDGFDSVLGRYYTDNGKDLSGGQWQLVSLARAYFRDSEFMILDEPSAALDPISEDRIFAQLYDLSDGKSAVTISHRLSNTMLADRILIIADGKITEQGTHEELMKQDGLYAHLFSLQASRYM